MKIKKKQKDKIKKVSIELEDDLISIGMVMQVKGYYKGKPCLRFLHLILCLLVIAAQLTISYKITTKELNVFSWFKEENVDNYTDEEKFDFVCVADRKIFFCCLPILVA